MIKSILKVISVAFITFSLTLISTVSSAIYLGWKRFKDNGN